MLSKVTSVALAKISSPALRMSTVSVLKQVQGRDDKHCNDLVVCQRPEESAGSGTLLYFGGDIQDYEDSMKDTGFKVYAEVNENYHLTSSR